MDTFIFQLEDLYYCPPVNSINTKRYSTNNNGPVTSPSDKEINDVLSQEPPIDINGGKSHHILSRDYTITKGGRQGFIVHVCVRMIPDSISGSPFSSYGKAHLALGLKANNRIVARYKDTGKLYKGQYLFTSSPVK